MTPSFQGAPRKRASMLLDPSSYARHPLHGEGVVWMEKNCYTDHWIELLHANGLPPEAMLPFVIGIDFEGDQWTFFKPVLDELRELYGARVNELTVWRPLVEHALEHLGSGRYIIADADAFWLPDTHGTDYRQKHSKTSIVLQAIDLESRQLGYFHNAGYFMLSGEDFAQTFRLQAEAEDIYLPPYAEIVSFDAAGGCRTADALRVQSRDLWRKHLRRAPGSNPVLRFAQHFARVLPQLQERGLDHYNAWAFANIRQLGAAFELAAGSLHWLGREGQPECPDAAQAFSQISNDAQRLIFLGARAVASRRQLDPMAHLAAAASHWESGIAALRKHFGVTRGD